jgi:hypothetical protein
VVCGISSDYSGLESPGPKGSCAESRNLCVGAIVDATGKFESAVGLNRISDGND